MGEKVGIIYMHHRVDEVTKYHYDLLVKHNPNATVFPVTGGDTGLPDAFEMKKSTGLNKMWQRITVGGFPKWAWRHLDVAFYQWYATNTEKCDRWVFTEWDLLCRMSVQEFYKEVWQCPLVAIDVHNQQDWDWYWHGNFKNVPEELRDYACACVPCAAVMISDELLAQVVDQVQKTYFDTLSEIRLGTLATYLGHPPVKIPRVRGRISWQALNYDVDVSAPGFYHPIKQMFDSK